MHRLARRMFLESGGYEIKNYACFIINCSNQAKSNLRKDLPAETLLKKLKHVKNARETTKKVEKFLIVKNWFLCDNVNLKHSFPFWTWTRNLNLSIGTAIESSINNFFIIAFDWGISWFHWRTVNFKKLEFWIFSSSTLKRRFRPTNFINKTKVEFSPFKLLLWKFLFFNLRSVWPYATYTQS